MATVTFNDVTLRCAYVAENQFSEADIATLNAEPNKIVEFAMDGTGLTNTQGASDKFYGFRENSGAIIYDARHPIVINNPSFTSESDISLWSDNGTSIISYDDVNNVMVINRNGGDYHKQCTQDLALDIGVEYTAKIYIYTPSSTSNLVIDEGDNIPLVSGDNTVTFTPTLATTNVSINGAGATDAIVRVTSIVVAKTTDFAYQSEIANYTDSIRTATANSQTSIQWTCAELDGAGIPLSYNSTPNTAIMHSDTQILTGYTPSATPYSLEETITGDLTDLNASGVSLGTTSQRTEVRLLTTDGTTHKLYIDGLLQGYTPSVPSESTEIDLNDTAVIGYADTIDSREADLKVWTTVRTDAQALADYNTWVLTYKDVLTDGNGDYLTDEYGRYLYA